MQLRFKASKDVELEMLSRREGLKWQYIAIIATCLVFILLLVVLTYLWYFL